jgi:hypothetical protein
MPIKSIRLVSAGCVAAVLMLGAPTHSPSATAAAPRSGLVAAPASRLTPTRGGTKRQTTGCELIGKAFGVITAGGDITYNGQRYRIEAVHSADNKVFYSGPNIRVIFTPNAGARLQEDEDGDPSRLSRPEPRGTARIEVDGHVVTTPALEHCVIFE